MAVRRTAYPSNWKPFPGQAIMWLKYKDEAGKSEKVSLSVKFSAIDTLPPIGKQKAYPAMKLVYIHATEEGAPEGRSKIDWRLVTNLPVASFEEAVEKLSWYALRWKIEVFHKVMKSGCKAEDARLRTAERLVKLLAIIAIVGARLLDQHVEPRQSRSPRLCPKRRASWPACWPQAR